MNTDWVERPRGMWRRSVKRASQVMAKLRDRLPLRSDLQDRHYVQTI